MAARPRLSYTIWFTQRTGSTWLCQALESTEIAGRPREYLSFDNINELFARYRVAEIPDLVAALYHEGTTRNGVFGIKHGYSEPRFGQLIDLLSSTHLPISSKRLSVWECIFPNHKHIFMTRRNKIRLAVSWWRAIQSGEWHRRHGQAPSSGDLVNRYDFQAIDQLLQESVFREAGIQEMFSEFGVVPLTIAYEDLEQNLTDSVRVILGYLGLGQESPSAPTTDLRRIADELSEEWVQRFRQDKQDGWRNVGW